MRIHYVAHPVAGDVPANLARALRWLKWLADRDHDTTYIAPWIAAIMSGEDDSDPYARTRGLRHDCNVVRRCDAIVLVGGRVSSGMAIERSTAITMGIDVIDLTDLGDEPPAEAG
jgi:hypothetical protein